MTLGDCTYTLPWGKKIKTGLVIKERDCSRKLAGFALKNRKERASLFSSGVH